MKTLDKSLDGAIRMREVFDEIGNPQFSHTDDDETAKESAVRLGVHEGLRAQAVNRPKGSAHAVIVNDGKLFLISYCWGHADAKQNGYTAFAIGLAAFKSRPDGASLFLKFVSGMIDAFELQVDAGSIQASIHGVWCN